MVTAKGAVAPKIKFSEKAGKFFRGVWSELKKVHWPNRQEIITYTSIVLVSVFIVALVIWVVDSGLSLLLEAIL